MVIANGVAGGETILDVVRGKPVGTLVTSNGHSEVIASAEQLAEEGERIARYVQWGVMYTSPLSARRGSQALQALTSEQRASILHKLAALLHEREADVMAANKRDLEAATELSAPLKSRLSLSSDKLASLAEGLCQLAGSCGHNYCMPLLVLLKR